MKLNSKLEISIITLLCGIGAIFMLALTIFKFDYLTIEGKFVTISCVLLSFIVTLISHKYCDEDF